MKHSCSFSASLTTHWIFRFPCTFTDFVKVKVVQKEEVNLTLMICGTTTTTNSDKQCVSIVFGVQCNMIPFTRLKAHAENLLNWCSSSVTIIIGVISVNQSIETDCLCIFIRMDFVNHLIKNTRSQNHSSQYAHTTDEYDEWALSSLCVG